MERTAIITFMRCQPPHIGHGLIFNEMRNQWLNDPFNQTYYIYLSKSFDKNKNPIKYEPKVQIAKKMFPLHQSRIVHDHPGNIIGILRELDSKYDNIMLYVGPDRVNSFDTLLNDYNGIEYNYKSLQVISIGSRNNSTILSSMSGTKMREALNNLDYSTFLTGMPENVAHISEEIYEKLINEITKAHEVK